MVLVTEPWRAPGVPQLIRELRELRRPFPEAPLHRCLCLWGRAPRAPRQTPPAGPGYEPPGAQTSGVLALGVSELREGVECGCGRGALDQAPCVFGVSHRIAWPYGRPSHSEAAAVVRNIKCQQCPLLSLCRSQDSAWLAEREGERGSPVTAETVLLKKAILWKPTQVFSGTSTFFKIHWIKPR